MKIRNPVAKAVRGMGNKVVQSRKRYIRERWNPRTLAWEEYEDDTPHHDTSECGCIECECGFDKDLRS